jgi:hypothetical protein
MQRQLANFIAKTLRSRRVRGPFVLTKERLLCSHDRNDARADDHRRERSFDEGETATRAARSLALMMMVRVHACILTLRPSSTS